MYAALEEVSQVGEGTRVEVRRAVEHQVDRVLDVPRLGAGLELVVREEADVLVVPLEVPMVVPLAVPEAVSMDSNKQPCHNTSQRSGQHLFLACTTRFQRLGESAHQKANQRF